MTDCASPIMAATSLFPSSRADPMAPGAGETVRQSMDRNQDGVPHLPVEVPATSCQVLDLVQAGVMSASAASTLSFKGTASFIRPRIIGGMRPPEGRLQPGPAPYCPLHHAEKRAPNSPCPTPRRPRAPTPWTASHPMTLPRARPPEGESPTTGVAKGYRRWDALRRVPRLGRRLSGGLRGRLRKPA